MSQIAEMIQMFADIIQIAVGALIGDMTLIADMIQGHAAVIAGMTRITGVIQIAAGTLIGDVIQTADMI